MKIKVDDLVLVAEYLNKNCKHGEVEITLGPIAADRCLEVRLSTQFGDERTIKVFMADAHRMPRIISEDQLRKI